jgi:hypothetical protein
MASSPDDDVGDEVRASARANLQEIIGAARNGESDTAALLDFLLLRARQRVAAVQAHVR